MEDIKVFFLYDESSSLYVVMCFCFQISICFICDPDVDLVLFKYLNLVLDLDTFICCMHTRCVMDGSTLVIACKILS